MSEPGAAPTSPFKGLAAFEDSALDALFFFGREREREVLVANLLAARLTVFYGESGVGKSSLLAAGVARELRARAPDAIVTLHDTWSGSLEGALAEVQAASEGYLILDQFEEYFLYYGDDDRPGALLHDLPELLRESRVNVLVSLREDGLAQLDAFKARIPSVFANQVRLEHLDRDAARAAILGPIARWNELTAEPVEIEPALVEAVLDEVTAGRVDGRASDRHRIEAPYLQLVLEKIWQIEREAGSTVLRVETLRDLGGATAIVRDHLDGALAALAPEEQDVAAEMFAHLVTPSGTKIAHGASDLAQYADVPEDVLLDVLATLTRDRIVHRVDSSDRYEIFHDVLTEPIRAWRQQRRLEQERREGDRRHRRLLVVAVGSALALAIVAAIALFALEERSSARAQARHARARELAATALADMSRDPARSLQLALAAARLERSPRIEEVLRTALVGSHLRLVLPARGAINAAEFSPDSRHALVGSADGSLAVYNVDTARRMWRLRLGAVATASFSPDGQRVLVGGTGGRVLLRPVEGFDAPLVLHQPGGLNAAVFGPDGSIVATGGDAGTVRVWSSDDGRLLRTLTPGDKVVSIAISPDGQRLAVVSQPPAGPSQAALYDLRDGRRIAEFRAATRIAFNRSGTLLVTGGTDRWARVWSAATGRFLVGMPHGKAVTAVEFSPDGRKLVTASADGAARVWSVAGGDRLLLMPTGTNVVTSAHYSTDGKYIVTAGTDGSAHIWNATNGRERLSLDGHRDTVVDAAFDRDAGRVITASDDRTARIWDTGLADQLRLLGRGPGPFVHVGFAAGDALAFGASRGGSLYVWRLRAAGPAVRLGRSPSLADATVSGTGSLAAAVDANGVGHLWQLPSGRVLLQIDGPRPGRRAAFSPDGRRLLFAGGNAVRIVDTATRRQVALLRLSGRVVDAHFSADGTHVVAATSNGHVRVWTEEGDLVRAVEAGPSSLVSVAVSPDSSRVAAAARDGGVQIWSVRTGLREHALIKARTALSTVEFSPNGRLLAAAAIGGDVKLWAVEHGTLVYTLRGHFGRVAAVSFSPDSRWIITAGPTAAGLWRTSTGSPLPYLRGHTRQVEAAAFGVDGQRIVTGSADGTVRTFDCLECGTIYQLAHLAHARLVHVATLLTSREKRRYLGG